MVIQFISMCALAESLHCGPKMHPSISSELVYILNIYLSSLYIQFIWSVNSYSYKFFFDFCFAEALVPSLGERESLQHKHEIKVDKPEECMYLLSTFFLHLNFPALPTLVKYREFCLNPPQDLLRQAYEFYRKALQCIYYRGKGIKSLF